MDGQTEEVGIKIDFGRILTLFVTSGTYMSHLQRVFGPGSVICIATGYGLERSGDRILVGARFSAPVQNGPESNPASCTMGTGSFLGVKSGRCVTLIPHSLLVPWSWNTRAIPLLSLWVVRPVQSLSACTRVHFNFTLQRVFSSPLG